MNLLPLEKPPLKGQFCIRIPQKLQECQMDRPCRVTVPQLAPPSHLLLWKLVHHLPRVNIGTNLLHPVPSRITLFAAWTPHMAPWTLPRMKPPP